MKINCDNKGIRQATVYQFGGNALTIPAIKVSIDMGCTDLPRDSKKKIVFSADHTGGSKVETEWKTFDTLQITYSKKIKPITQIEKVTFTDTTLNVIIEYNEI